MSDGRSAQVPTSLGSNGSGRVPAPDARAQISGGSAASVEAILAALADILSGRRRVRVMPYDDQRGDGSGWTVNIEKPNRYGR